MRHVVVAATLACGLLIGLNGTAQARPFRGYVYRAPSYYVAPVAPWGYGFGGYYGGYAYPSYGYYGVPNYSSYWPASAYSYTFPAAPVYSYGYYAPGGFSYYYGW